MERRLSTTTEHSRSSIEIERVESPSDDVRALVAELEAELSANYPPQQRHGLALNAIFQPHIRFFIARHNGRAIGCGGIALFADFAEVKRMYVRPDARGKAGAGVADAIIARLTAEARGAGLNILRLETGTQQSAALRFYERCGFQRCEAFEPYASMPPQSIVTSVFLEKRIA
jgi:putative acetyltransferase